jgi:hypothetical protein
VQADQLVNKAYSRFDELPEIALDPLKDLGVAAKPQPVWLGVDDDMVARLQSQLVAQRGGNNLLANSLWTCSEGLPRIEKG